MNGVPLIRLEVEYMKHSIVHALSEYQVQMDQQLKVAVEKACSPENLQRVLDQEVRNTLDLAIKNELDHFFRFGDGKDVLRDAVNMAIKRTQQPKRKQQDRR